MPSLRTVIATTLQVIDTDECFIPQPQTAGSKNPCTLTKVMDLLSEGKTPDEDFNMLADEIVIFFRELPTTKLYTELKKKPESAMYQSCIDSAAQEEVSTSNIAFVVNMPNVFGKIRPKPSVANISIEIAESTPPNSFMGQRGTAGRFFVKLIRVGAYDKDYGGNVFELKDRNNNIGVFYEQPNRLKDKFHLGDCFSMYAIPERHLNTDTGKQTVFRAVQIVENKGQSGTAVPNTQDTTGLFSNN